jgi:predicted aspartyl protease
MTISGEVTSRREIVFPLTLAGPDGTSVDVNSVLDTGFDDFLTLTRELIAALGLEYVGSMPIMLADGQIVTTELYRVKVRWHDGFRTVSAQATDAGLFIGMAMIYGSLVTIEAVDGGAAIIEDMQPDEQL